jgi:hypothetical protein
VSRPSSTWIDEAKCRSQLLARFLPAGVRAAGQVLNAAKRPWSAADLDAAAGRLVGPLVVLMSAGGLEELRAEVRVRLDAGQRELVQDQRRGVLDRGLLELVLQAYGVLPVSRMPMSQ